MSRLKNFTRSLLSGYAQIAVNVLYTLASVPLALHYLSKSGIRTLGADAASGRLH